MSTIGNVGLDAGDGGALCVATDRIVRHGRSDRGRLTSAAGVVRVGRQTQRKTTETRTFDPQALGSPCGADPRTAPVHKTLVLCLSGIRSSGLFWLLVSRLRELARPRPAVEESGARWIPTDKSRPIKRVWAQDTMPTNETLSPRPCPSRARAGARATTTPKWHKHSDAPQKNAASARFRRHFSQRPWPCVNWPGGRDGFAGASETRPAD
jgi:hypothetical protein